MANLTQARRQVWWVGVLFAADFCLQRFTVPGINIAVTVPLAIIWLVLGVVRKVVEIDLPRMVLWLVAGGVTALLAVPQVLLTPFPIISVTSWAFWMVVWLPVVVRFTDRSPTAHRAALRGVANVGLGLSTLSILFLAVQAAGVAYRDLFAQIIPARFVLEGYVTTYPIAYGSPLYKPNGWLALEPSFLSFMLGVSAVAAIIAGQHLLKVTWLLFGLAATTAGSGIAVLLAFVGAALLLGRARHLLRYLVPVVAVGVILSVSALGPYVLGRVTEVGQPRSSTSLRMIDPYQKLWPYWTSDPIVTLLGRGAGSSQRLVSDLAITGLVVPTPAKVLFDYGVLGGALLLVLVVAAYLRSPAPALAFALAVSMLTLQTASQPLVLCSFLVVTFFAPAAPDPAPADAYRDTATDAAWPVVNRYTRIASG